MQVPTETDPSSWPNTIPCAPAPERVRLLMSLSVPQLSNSNLFSAPHHSSTGMCTGGTLLKRKKEAQMQHGDEASRLQKERNEKKEKKKTHSVTNQSRIERARGDFFFVLMVWTINKKGTRPQVCNNPCCCCFPSHHLHKDWDLCVEGVQIPTVYWYQKRSPPAIKNQISR